MTTPPHSGRERDEVSRVRDRFERLLAAGVAVASEHALPEVLRKVTDSARDVVGARYAALGVLTEDGRRVEQFVTSGIEPELHRRIGEPPSGKGMLGAVIREARPIRVRAIAENEHAAGFPPHHPPMTSFLGVPIKSRQRVYGNLYLTDKLDAPEFSDEDEKLAVMLASIAAAAIENARLFEETSGLLAQVQQMQRQRDQFFAMINHELRNALTGVFGWAERLLRSRNPASIERAATEVFESAERTIALMNNLLDLSRLDAGRIQAVFRETDMRRVAMRAIAAVQPVAEAKQIVLRLEAQEPAPVATTDGIRLEQIVVNLLTNAVRHSASGEDVRVRVATVGEEALLEVIDRGKGIALEDQERIFEPYVRTDPESGLGSGLGLPVSRRLAEVLGGRLTVHSDLGRGATFAVAIPLGSGGGART